MYVKERWALCNRIKSTHKKTKEKTQIDIWKGNLMIENNMTKKKCGIWIEVGRNQQGMVLFLQAK